MNNSKTLQLTVRISEFDNQAIKEAHEAFQEEIGTYVSYSSFLLKLLRVGLSQETSSKEAVKTIMDPDPS